MRRLRIVLKVGGDGLGGLPRRFSETQVVRQKHRLRRRFDCEVISFPNISTGIYGFPKDLAAETALNTVRYHDTKVARVIFVCFDLENLALYKALMQ